MIYKQLFAIFMSFYLISFSTAAEFVCSTDQIYKDYKAGDRLDLDGALKYAGKDICENNCRDYSPCSADTDGSFYCSIRQYENLGGDVGGTNFSNQSTCESKCFFPNSCVELRENPCVPVDIEYTHPVTDYTGKTIYTQRKIIYKCETKETKQVGCNKWEIKLNTGSFDYNTSGIGTIYKSQSQGQDAQNTMAMLEQQLHIFSGWAGYCEDGTVFNNPFSDPMAILGYAMMVYSAAGTGDLGETAKSAHDSLTSTYDAAADQINYATDPNGLGRMDFETWNATQNGYTGAAGGRSILDSVTNMKEWSDMNTITTLVSKDSVSFLANDINLLYTDLAQIAMLMMPTEEEIQQADYFNKAWMGDADADQAALGYASCMASIGLSMPNLVSFSAGDINNTSSELNKVYENPIRLTYNQLATLMASTSPKYVEAAYKKYDYDPDEKIMTLIARNGNAYYEAGQVICGGKLAISQNILAKQATLDSTDGGGGSSIGKSLAIMAVKKVLVAAFPVAGIIASVIIDIVTSLESGDACHDPEVALKWGIDQLKTNKFLNFDQCHHTKSDCVAKWFWGSCMRDRHDYCCYDQISTRIFAEGLKMQMYPPNDPKMWEKCNDITINDLKNISFRKCLTGEEAYADHCFPASKYEEFEEAIKRGGVANFDFGDAANQAINSLAVPNKVCEAKE